MIFSNLLYKTSGFLQIENNSNGEGVFREGC